jgi:hypothetical protein
MTIEDVAEERHIDGALVHELRDANEVLGPADT